MNWRDLSLPLRPGMIAWPDDPPMRVETVSSVARDGVRVSRIDMGSHTGTHIDAPAHFIEGGGAIDDIPAERLIGACRVLDLTHVREVIGAEELEPLTPRAGERILLKTRNAAMLRVGLFEEAYVALDLSAAELLARVGVALVGIDALSIEPYELGVAHSYAVHKTLLGRDVVIVEGLDLADVEAGVYSLVALPLRFAGLDASPARVLIKPL